MLFGCLGNVAYMQKKKPFSIKKKKKKKRCSTASIFSFPPQFVYKSPSTSNQHSLKTALIVERIKYFEGERFWNLKDEFNLALTLTIQIRTDSKSPTDKRYS